MYVCMTECNKEQINATSKMKWENAVSFFNGNTPEPQKEAVTAFKCSGGFVRSFITTVPTPLHFVQGLLAYI